MTAPHDPMSVPEFAETLARVRPALERVLAGYDLPVEDAEDVLQDCYLTLLYKWESVRCPEAWLIGTLRKKCLMYWRKRRRRFFDAMETGLLEVLLEPERPLQENRDLSRDFERVLSRLPPRCHQLLRLRFVLGLAPAEVAERMGYQASSIRKITSRCMTVLTRELVSVGFLENGR